MNQMTFVITLVSMILIVPFFTLLERKVLSYSQLRKGPKKIGPFGIVQPMSDGIKLFTKVMKVPIKSHQMLFLTTPVLMFFFMILNWFNFPSMSGVYMFKWSILLFMMMSSLSVYPLLFSGWASKSKFTLLGSFRKIIQIMSFEISLFTFMLFPLMVFSSYKMNKIISINLLFFCVGVFSWLILILVETKRSPFDFAEGESELVSGFKTEYSSMWFILLFLSEYGAILFFSMLSSIIFFKNIYFTLGFLFFFLWQRATFPRFRFDLLMEFSWKGIFILLLVLFLIILLI